MHTARIVPMLLILLLSACVHRTPQDQAIERAWREARGGEPVIQSSAALQQRLTALQRLAMARKFANDEAKCVAHPDRSRCLAEQRDLDNIVVTGSRIAAADVVTNNQEAGIDEGGIVKKSGDFLIVLRKGTLYSIALSGAGHSGLRVVDQQLAATDDSGFGVWYDEILALDGRIVLLGYGGGSQLIGFRLDAAGRLHRDWHYTLTSDDYFSGENYGMRLHGDRLVFKQSLTLEFGQRVVWPTWRRAAEHRSAGRPLVEVPQLLMPGLVSDRPTLHLLLSCALSALDAGHFECDARGVLSDGPSELYVGPSAAYLALPAWDDELYLDPEFSAWGWSPRRSDRQLAASRQTWLVRFPLGESNGPTMVRIRGEIRNQFSLKQLDERLHALANAGQGKERSLLVYRIEPGAFSAAGNFVTPHRSLPGIAESNVRMTNRAAYLVRGTDDDEERSAALIALDLHSDDMSEVALDFWPQRLEPALNHMVLVGASSGGMRFALLPDHPKPRLYDQIDVVGYRQAESRSHAFNAGRPHLGRAVFGLPVVSNQRVGKDLDQTEAVSDVLLVDMSEQRLRQLGVVDMASRAQPARDCELSCYDWYGNARVFFVGERIFALSADQLVELRLHGGSLQEIERAQLSD